MNRLELNEKLFIEEFEDVEDLYHVIHCDLQGLSFWNYGEDPKKPICKGHKLTEDVAKRLLQIIDYRGDLINNALETFISVIKSKGFHWNGELSEYGILEESEPGIFNPYKTLIMEII